MAKYSYQGRFPQGQEIKGEMDANSKDAVANSLVQRNIIPVRIDEVSVASSAFKKIDVWLGSEKVSNKDLIMFCRQMYTISKSGLPLTRGLRGLSASIKHEHFKKVLIDIAERLEAGSSLARAMKHHDKVFNSLFVSMINVGEASGNLDTVFEQVAFYIDRDEETKKRVKQATRYPMFVCIAILFAMVAVNLWVIPAFAGMFKQFGADLPLVTKILIGTSNFFVDFWVYLLFSTIGLVVWAILFFRSDAGKMFWGEKSLQIPIAGELIGRASMARYARSMALMLRTGVPINQSLSLCSAAIDNAFIAKKINKIQGGIERGESMLKTHVQAELFTPLVIQMIAVGEESGQIEILLNDVAEFYEREVDYDLKTLTDKIEPILIVTMAIFVGILAVGIFLPMWSMYDIQS